MKIEIKLLNKISSKNRHKNDDSDKTEMENQSVQKDTPKNELLLDEVCFKIKQGDFNTFMEMVNKASETKLSYSIPTFFHVMGSEESEKMVFLRQAFIRNRKVLFKDSLDSSELIKVFQLKSIPEILIIDTDFKEPDAADAIEHLFHVFTGVVIFVTEPDTIMPDVVGNSLVYTLELETASKLVYYKKTNEILTHSGQKEIEQKDYETIVDKIGTNNMGLVLSVVMKERLRDKYNLEKQQNYVNLKEDIEKCFSEVEFNNKYRSLFENANPLMQADYKNLILDLYTKLSKKIIYLNAEEKAVARIESLIRNEHTNIMNPDDVMAMIKVAAINKDKKITMSPILFVGPSGCGKTRLAKKIAKCFDQNKTVFISCSTGLGISGIMGSTPDYKAASYGKILESIWVSKQDACCLNPCIIIDEIDKGMYGYIGDANQNLYGTLLTLLEKENSESFTDNFFGIPVNNFNPNYFITANDTSTIPEPLLNRMIVIHFRDYTKEELVSQVIPAKYHDFAATHEVPQDLSEEEYRLVAKLASFSTRKIDLAINKYIAHSRYISDANQDFTEIEHRLLKIENKTENGIGFRYENER